MKQSLKIFTAMLIFMSAPNAYAWSEETHMTTGAIAYDTILGQQPNLLSDIDAIVADHPNFKQLSAHAGNLRGNDRLRVMMQWMARWPDDIRGTIYSHPEWHVELRVVHGRTWLWPFRNESALEGLSVNYNIFADKESTNEQRAIALSWLLHIIGDIQQPLHAGHQMTSDFPATDRAGQLAYIRKSSDNSVTDLHQYWDKILDVDGPVDATSKKWAPALQAEWRYGPQTMMTYSGTADEQFSKWLDESAHLAKIVAYTGSYLKASPDRAYAPKITAKEQRIAAALSKRRVATGGYRIADTIIMALKF